VLDKKHNPQARSQQGGEGEWADDLSLGAKRLTFTVRALIN